MYESGWNRGSTGFTRIYKDILSNKEANETMAEFVRAKIRNTVKDPQVTALLTPTDHYIGTKRICRASRACSCPTSAGTATTA